MSGDEFRFLAADATRVGRDAPLPEVRRVDTRTGDGRIVSGLAFCPARTPQLVALHGAGLNAHSFDPMLLALDAAAGDVPALALDLPGHGRSDWRADADYRPGTIAGDVAHAIAAHATAPVTLVGHSLGGLTAALVAADRPDLVAGLVVVDITPDVSQRGAAGKVAAFISGQRDYGSIAEIVDRAIAFGIGSNPASLTRGVALNTRTRADGRLEWTHHLAHLPGLTGAAGATPNRDVWAALEHLAVPTTLVRASAGLVDDAAASAWRRRLPASEIVTLAGPHNLHEAAPRELAAAVRAATARTRSGP